MKLSQTLASTAILICLHLFRLGSAAPTFDGALSKRIAPAPPVLTKCSSPDESRNQVSMIFTWKDLLTQTNSPNAEIDIIVDDNESVFKKSIDKAEDTFIIDYRVTQENGGEKRELVITPGNIDAINAGKTDQMGSPEKIGRSKRPIKVKLSAFAGNIVSSNTINLDSDCPYIKP